VEGLEEGGGLAPSGRGQLEQRDTAGSGPGAARVSTQRRVAGGREEREARARVGKRSSAGSGPAATRVGSAAWYVARPAEQGRGGAADRWAAAIVPGSGTG
jgi:hypothetical protein